MKRRNQILAALLLAGLIAAGGCTPSTGLLIRPVSTNQKLKETVLQKDPGWFIRDKIAVVSVTGLLMNERASGLFGSGENPTSLFVEEIDKAQADPNVKAIIVRINSPGGGVTASDIMYRRLIRYRDQTKHPVIAVVEDIGASGAYYVACGADRIMALPTAITGSIGVIVQTVSFAGTMRLLGIDAKAVVSGPYKDMLSPLKPLDEKDLKIVQGLVNNFYSRFLKVVDDGRPKLTADEVRKLADGRVYSAQQALANGLVDKLGYMSDAIALAKKLSGAKRVKVVMYHRPWGYKANAYSTARMEAPQINLLNVNVPDLLLADQPRFMYLWPGGRLQGD